MKNLTGLGVIVECLIRSNLVIEANIYTQNSIDFASFIENTAIDDSCCLISYDGITNIGYNEDGTVDTYDNVFSVYIKLKEITEKTIQDIIKKFNDISVGLMIINNMSIENGVIVIGITI